jgi:hypothetical protein
MAYGSHVGTRVTLRSGNARHGLFEQLGKCPELDLLAKTQSNLLRRWAEDCARDWPADPQRLMVEVLNTIGGKWYYVMFNNPIGAIL